MGGGTRAREGGSRGFGSGGVGTPRPEPLYPPHPTGYPKHHFSSFCTRQKYDASCEICSVPGARAPTTYPPGTKALGPHPEPHPQPRLLGPVPLPPTPPEPHPLDPPRNRKLRNLLRPWGPCPYHLPPRHRSPWSPPEPQPRA